MEISVLFIISLGIAATMVTYCMRLSSKNNVLRQETIERRKAYVTSISPSARVIVNDGTHLFFKDDTKQIFGMDESGKTYSFSGLHSICVFRDSVSLMHRDSVSLWVGKDPSCQNTTSSLDSASIAAIKAELLPVLRKNLYVELEKHGVSPTHEYEHDGEIWGCDTNSGKFYVASGDFSIYNFSDLRRVAIEDLRNNSLFDGSYIIHVYVEWDSTGDDFDYEIHFKSKNATFHDLLAMFKGIRNRSHT